MYFNYHLLLIGTRYTLFQVEQWLWIDTVNKIDTVNRHSEYNGDRNHYCFQWELNYVLNLGLKQRHCVYGTMKGSISNFRILFFHSFSRWRFPHVPRFDITQVIYTYGAVPQIQGQIATANSAWEFFHGYQNPIFFFFFCTLVIRYSTY